MRSLTETTYWTRKGIKFGAIFLVVFFLLRSLLGAFTAYWKSRHPAPLPLPTVAFGKLPKPLLSISSGQPNIFRLETIDGDLPVLPDQMKVYFINPQQAKFLAMEKTTKLAMRLGFVHEPKKIREDLFRYENQTNNTTLTINPLTQAFKLEYPYLKDQILTGLFLPSQEIIISTAQAMLDKTAIDHLDLTPEKIKISFWKLAPTKLTAAPSLSEANLAQVNFFRTDIEEKYPIYPPNLDKPNLYLTISGSDSVNKKVVEFNHTYFLIDREKSATYPLKPISQAWEEIKNGQYHLAAIGPQYKDKEIAVRKVYLGYLDPDQPTNFLQPIYIFEGDEGFVGFVSAVSIEWVND